MARITNYNGFSRGTPVKPRHEPSAAPDAVVWSVERSSAGAVSITVVSCTGFKSYRPESLKVCRKPTMVQHVRAEKVLGRA